MGGCGEADQPHVVARYCRTAREGREGSRELRLVFGPL